ncbi:MAG: Gfo/Idh/MocA family protein [bacterium]
MSEALKIGLIGCGHQGRDNLSPALCNLEGVRLVACADVNEEMARRASSDFGYERCYLDYDKMLSEEDLDAVVVAVTNNILKDASIASIEAGCHLFVEKPMGINAGEGRAIVEAARREGVRVMVGYCLRFNETRRFMKDLIDRGGLGEIGAVNAFIGSAPWTNWYADPKMGGGQLLFLGVHLIDQILWMVGRRVERVWGEVHRHPERGYDENSSFTIAFEGGVLASVSVSMKASRRFDFVEIVGSRGHIRGEWPTNVVYVLSPEIPGVWVGFKSAPPATEIRPFVRDYLRPMFEAEMREFVSAILEGRETAIPGPDGVRVLEVVDAVFESSGRGVPVDLRGI